MFTDSTISRPDEQGFVTELSRANAVIDQLMETSPDIIHLKEQSRQNITGYERSICQRRLREKFKSALIQRGISPGIVCGFSHMVAYNTVRDIGCGAHDGACCRFMHLFN